MLGRLAAPPASAGCLDLEQIEALESAGAILPLDGKDSLQQIGELRDFIREQLGSADALLAERFWAGHDVVELVHSRAWVVEQLLLLAWKRLVPFMDGAVNCTPAPMSIC